MSADNTLVLTLEHRKKLATILNGLPVNTPEDLLARISALAELSIGGIRFKWTAHQFRELQEKAARWRMTPEAYAERIVREIEGQFFSYNPRENQKSEPILEKPNASQP